MSSLNRVQHCFTRDPPAWPPVRCLIVHLSFVSIHSAELLHVHAAPKSKCQVSIMIQAFRSRFRSVRIVAHRPFILLLAGPYITQGELRVAVSRVTTDRFRETLRRFAEAPLGTEDQPQIQERFVHAPIGNPAPLRCTSSASPSLPREARRPPR
jgi:hypothetical protein